MKKLALHDYHQRLGARFFEDNGMEAVESYGDPAGEYELLHSSAGVLDLGFRGRVCMNGADRKRFLHGQVTNEVNGLKVGEGCYAALTTAKGKMESDLNIYCTADELLLEFEPGLTQRITERLERYIIADDVQVVDVAADYGLLSVQGPRAEEVISRADLELEPPKGAYCFTKACSGNLGEIYCMNVPRDVRNGFDVFVPTEKLVTAANKLFEAGKAVGGGPCGCQALEAARIEAGFPRFGVDMDETNLPPEAGIDQRAVSYTKGCYIGQEVIARLRTYGHAAKTLKRLRFAPNLKVLPSKGDKLFHDTKEAGYITSAAASLTLSASVGLGYVRREFDREGMRLTLRTGDGESIVEITGPVRG